MKILFRHLNKFIMVLVLLSIGTFTTTAYASHSWGDYHWARTANPFTLKLGDNVTSAWDAYLNTTSNDWSLSSALNTTIIAGQTNSKNCRAVKGKVQICNNTYGKNGWLGVAQIWVNGNHIVQGTVKVNDTYFKTPTYNTSAWKNLVMCQEVGHTLGLDHQDEIFDNPNLGTCMDYTSNPSTNQHPNTHDYYQLEIIYQHLDSFTTLLSKIGKTSPASVDDNINASDPSEWGRVVRKSKNGHNSLHERDLGKGNKVFTFVTWVN